MKYNTKWLAAAVAIASGLAIINPAVANTTINSFDSFTSDALYGSWSTPAATIVSGPTSYMVSSYGWGSNWKYNPVDGSGNATLQLTVTLSGLPDHGQPSFFHFADSASLSQTLSLFILTVSGASA